LSQAERVENVHEISGTDNARRKFELDGLIAQANAVKSRRAARAWPVQKMTRKENPTRRSHYRTRIHSGRHIVFVSVDRSVHNQFCLVVVVVKSSLCPRRSRSSRAIGAFALAIETMFSSSIWHLLSFELIAQG